MSESENREATRIDIKIGDEEMKGRYSNVVRVVHTREEFILDFLHVVPPQGIVTARVITSPGHLKRIVQALTTNLARYEEAHGPIVHAEPPEIKGVH
jgi:Protein of unknown function (DUF3467)